MRIYLFLSIMISMDIYWPMKSIYNYVYIFNHRSYSTLFWIVLQIFCTSLIKRLRLLINVPSYHQNILTYNFPLKTLKIQTRRYNFPIVILFTGYFVNLYIIHLMYNHMLIVACLRREKRNIKNGKYRRATRRVTRRSRIPRGIKS